MTEQQTMTEAPDEVQVPIPPAAGPMSYGALCAELNAERDDAERLRTTLDLVREWRHKHGEDDPQFAELDEILAAEAVERIRQHLVAPEPTSLPEAVQAHHRILRERRRAFNHAGHAWDEVEARMIRQIARFMPPAGQEGSEARE